MRPLQDTYHRHSEIGTVSSGLLSADAVVSSLPGKVYWLTVSDSAILLIELNDSTDNTGSDKWGIRLPADGYAHLIFDPPIEFATGIYLDVDTSTCRVTIGYV